MQAQDVMTPNPTTVPPHASVAEAWDLMRQHAVRHMPVVDRGALIGMLSDRDLAHFDMARLLTAEGAEGLRRELGTPVVKIMSADVVAVNPDAELGEIVDLLVENRIGAVAVVRPETQELVGIVSYIDVLEAVRDLLEVADGGRAALRALACDYDGTLAEHDKIAPATLEALQRARAAGMRLLLVTGRTLFELTRVCKHLDVFDAVVAENGAVTARWSPRRPARRTSFGRSVRFLAPP